MKTLNHSCLAAILFSALACGVAAAAERAEIVAAKPVIPEGKFNLVDFGGVGDGKSMNTDAFRNAIAAIAKAGGGHLIVPAGTYRTLPFTLTSRMDLHLDAGTTIQASDKFEDYGIPDPNQAAAAGVEGAGTRPTALISGTNLTDVAITGSGTIDGYGA